MEVQEFANIFMQALNSYAQAKGVDLAPSAFSLTPQIEKQGKQEGNFYFRTPSHNLQRMIEKNRNLGQQEKFTVGTGNEGQMWYNNGGLFTDCDLERPVINATLQPQKTLLERLPIEPTILESRKFAYVTQVEEAGGVDDASTVCENCPSIGDISKCTATWAIGRLCYETKTLELDTIIRKASIGVRDNLYFLGDIQGMNVWPSQTMLNDRNIVQMAAVRYQLYMLGRTFRRTLATWIWTGDPTDATQNVNPGAHTDADAWKSFYGLNLLIADDYGDALAKPFVSGDNCAALNSLVIDFAEGVLGTDAIFPTLQGVEFELYNRADLYGLLPVQWEIWMHPTTWSEMVKILPCEMVGDGCSGGVINANDGATGLFNMATRERMENTMTLRLNGRTYSVYTDHFIPATSGVNPGEILASIYFIPFTVAGGQRVLWLQHMDYTQFTAALQPVTQQQLNGWSDGGRFHHVIINDGRCFLVNTKIEPGLIFIAPHLAARIDDVLAAPTIEISQPITPAEAPIP